MGGCAQGDVAVPRVLGLSADVAGNHFLTGGVAGTAGEGGSGRSQREQDHTHPETVEGRSHRYTHFMLKGNQSNEGQRRQQRI